MSTSPININDEKTPLLISNEHHHTPPITVQTPPSNEPGTLTTDGKAPCAKYGNEENLTSSSTHNTQRAKRKLIIACILCVLFLVGEFVGRSYSWSIIGRSVSTLVGQFVHLKNVFSFILGGYLANSLAIITDAAHLLSDLASFLISLLAIWFATRPSTSKLSYGWHRAGELF